MLCCVPGLARSGAVERSDEYLEARSYFLFSFLLDGSDVLQYGTAEQKDGWKL